MRHVEVLEIYQAAWSLLILGDLDPYPPLPAPNPSVPTRSAKGRQTPRILPHRFARLTNEQVAVLLAAYEAGDSTYQLAERFGIHRQTVAATLRRASVATRGLQRVKLTEEQRDEAQRLWDEGVSYHRIGISLGVGERVVSRTLRRC